MKHNESVKVVNVDKTQMTAAHLDDAIITHIATTANYESE